MPNLALPIAIGLFDLSHQPDGLGRRHLAMVFAIQATLQGMFATQDLLSFTLLSAVELVLIAYLLQR